MKFLDKIFLQRHTETSPSIRTYQKHDVLSNQDIANIQKIILKNYKGSDSESIVLTMLEKLLSVKHGCISIEYNKDFNIIAVYYCCTWDTAKYWV